VATAAYAAGGIAGANPDRVGWLAMRIGLVAFIVPYMFVFGPALVMVGTPIQVCIAMVTATIGCIVLAFATEGFILRRLYWYERVLCFIASLLLLHPRPLTDFPGIVLVVLLVMIQYYQRVASKRVKPTVKGL